MGEAAAEPAGVALTPAMEAGIARLKREAARSDAAYEIACALVRDVGPRMAGGEAEARARAWALAKFAALGLAAHEESFSAPMWRRTHESAALTAPATRPLAIAALGGSAPTPAGGLEAEIVRFANLAALNAADAATVAGKIVFIDAKMAPSQDGSTYAAAVGARRRCPLLAREKGAAACVIRTIGTSARRVANTGNITAREMCVLPAAALSNPDSDELTYLLGQGPARMRLEIGVETRPVAPSGNVVAEIHGRERPHEIVLIAAHLDSWDITPGARDDAAGVGIVMAAAKLIADLPQRPERTIRVVLFGAEEIGLLGGAAYVAAHKEELAAHVLASESDFGGETLWRVRTRFGAGAGPQAGALRSALADLAISGGEAPARGESEVSLLAAAGVPVVDLDADATTYFDVHHTIDDVVEGLDAAALRQNVAAYATLAYLAAESDWDFRAGGMASGAARAGGEASP